MKPGRASQTALRVAIRRAAHQLVDLPPVLDDPIALPLLGNGYKRDLERAMHRVARDFRGFMAARTRYVEDRLAYAVANGIVQYVILGAGLDTFAYRNPFPTLRVFEVDFPATQAWKQRKLAEAGIAVPDGLTFVPLDLEHKQLAEGLAEAGFDSGMPAFFSWVGIVPYLTIDGFRATLATVGGLPHGTGIVFDTVDAPDTLTPPRRKIFDGLSKRLAAAGEPLRLFLSPRELEHELRRAGFDRTEQVGIEQLNELYFRNRADGLRLSPSGVGTLVCAWV
jgi:methyltransferase (TIGR00027 family)